MSDEKKNLESTMYVISKELASTPKTVFVETYRYVHPPEKTPGVGKGGGEAMTTKKKATPKVMRFVDQDHFECKVCGTQVPLSNIMLQGGGKFPRGTWQCPYGCKIEDAKGGRA